MKWVFWASAALIAYTYAGYPAWLWLRLKFFPRQVEKKQCQPALSIVMVVRNEERNLRAKLDNLFTLDYPAAKKQIVVVSDGSTDQTNAILKSWPGIDAYCSSTPQGKAAGLNHAVGLSTGEILIFTDVRQMIEPDAIHQIVENFADPNVGCVSGELMLGDPARGESSQGMGFYWRVEKQIRELESATGSVVGATGAIYGVRRSLITALPEGLILDDVYIPMQVVRQGARVLFEPKARAWDSANLGEDREFKRKVRTLTGNYQLVQMAPWLLGRSNPIRFEFISHKLTRLAVPFALLGLLLSSAWLGGVFYRAAFVLQLGFYGLSGLATARLNFGPLSRLADAALTFVVLNSAAALAFLNFISGRKTIWAR